MPKSSRIFANATARLTPVCEQATSTTSSSRLMGTPFCSKCTVTATNALWFGDVQASVPKCNAPSWSCQRCVYHNNPISYTYLKHFSNALACFLEDVLHVPAHCSARWDLVCRSSRFHQLLEPAILNDAKRTLALWDPLHDLGTIDYTVNRATRAKEEGPTVPLLLCVDDVSSWFFLCLFCWKPP